MDEKMNEGKNLRSSERKKERKLEQGQRSMKKKVWLGLVLWHVNHCWLFNAKSYLYISIEYV